MCGSCDAVDDLLAWYRLGDEPLGAGTHGTTYRLRPIGKAEYHDRPVTGVGAKSAHPFAEESEFSVGVEERDIDPSPRSLLHIDFDDLDLRLTGPPEGPQALEDDHVVVDERDPDRFGRIGLATAAL